MLAEQEVVITTYDVLRTELNYVDIPHSNSEDGRRFRNQKRYMAIPSPLVAVEWWRICLDEAQMVECTTAKVWHSWSCIHLTWKCFDKFIVNNRVVFPLPLIMFRVHSCNLSLSLALWKWMFCWRYLLLKGSPVGILADCEIYPAQKILNIIYTDSLKN